MGQKLPRSLIFALACFAMVSFAASLYLESFQLAFLQNHPISVNLLSGVVGFSCATLVVGIGFNWIRARKYRWGFSQQLLFGRFESRVMTMLDAVRAQVVDGEGEDSDDDVQSIVELTTAVRAQMWSPNIRSSYNFPSNGLGGVESMLNASDSLLDGQVAGLIRVFDFTSPEMIELEVASSKDTLREVRSLQQGGVQVPMRTLASTLRKLYNLVNAVYSQPEFQRFHKWFIGRNASPSFGMGDPDMVMVVDAEDEFSAFFNYYSPRGKPTHIN
jgi:hypothetical protein